MPTALVRRPSPRLPEGLLTHQVPVPVDADLALRQWHRYVEVFADTGWDVIEAPDLPEQPDGVFIEDTVVVVDDVALLTRPGAESRRGEVDSTARAITDLGYRTVRVGAPATLEGGDVLKVGRCMFVGLSGRTNAAGVEALRTTFEPCGIQVRTVAVTRVLHLKSGVTALPDGTILGFPGLIPDARSMNHTYLPAAEPGGSHIVALDDERLLIAASAPETAAMLKGLGYQPIPVDVSEFEKVEGCVTCLSVRLRGHTPGD